MISTSARFPNRADTTYDRHKDRLRQELTLLEIDRHSGQLDKFDVESILAFAERVLPRAADLWVQASLEQRQRLQQLFFADGVVFDGKGFVRTGVSTHAFKYLTPDLPTGKNLASLTEFVPAGARGEKRAPRDGVREGTPATERSEGAGVPDGTESLLPHRLRGANRRVAACSGAGRLRLGRTHRPAQPRGSTRLRSLR
jgi:hypothetical protein